MSSTCQVGGRFSRCHNPAINTCQYCARAFCEDHRYFVEGHDAVCTRKRCQAKFDDLRRHMEYKQRTRQRNAAGLCGAEGCGPHPGAECSLCNARFCEQHIKERMYPLRQGFATVDRPMSVCEWCWQRRKVWRR